MANHPHQFPARDKVPASTTAPLSSVRIPAGLEESSAQKPLAGAASGLLAGAALGAFAGPIGIVAGGIVGGVAGAVAGVALDTEEEITAKKEERLDKEIGVIGGSLGAASPNAPKSERGWFSPASSGAASSGNSTDSSPDAGPFPKSE